MVMKKAEMINQLFGPKFNGDNPQQWVFNIQAYFDFHKIPLDERLNLVGRNLEGGALEWYRWMRSHNFQKSWSDLLEKVKISFEPSEFEHYEAKLSKLTQKGSVAEFQAEFEGLVNNIVIGVSESLLVSYFVAGLRPDLKAEVEASEPRTVKEAFAVAAYYEEMRRAVARWIEVANRGLPGSTKKLSPAELREKRNKGLCFHCDKIFNPKLPCKCRG